MTRTWVLFALLPAIVGATSQTPLIASSWSHTAPKPTNQFKWPIRRVAIIGAGPGGLISYRELSDAGFNVHVYERDNSPGGNWHYTEETPVDAPVPNVDISVGDYTPSLPPKGVKYPYVEEYHNKSVASQLRRAHRAPKPVWASLKSNAPAPIQQIREFLWPKGTPWELPHRKLTQYLRAFASWHGINNNDGSPNISYNTRVELVKKRYNEDGNEAGWTLTLKTVVQTGPSTTTATWTQEAFDAVVIATGRYNAPNIPNIEGLEEWAKRFPDHISHSRQYRRPQPYANKTVLIVGAATSGGEISRDINPYANTIYQSIRPDKATVPHFNLSLFFHRLPLNTTVVPEIKRFHAPGSHFKDGRVELVNGTVLTGIDHIIFGTGFRYTYPFLPQYHNSSLGLNDTIPRGEGIQPIVTDGTHLRSLYLDSFYIEEPTLAFVNVNFGLQSFTYAEFVSLAVAKVWAGKADFPSTPELWKRYDEIVEERKGYGRHFQFLGAERTQNNLRFFQGWLNDAAAKYGGRQIDGLPKELEEISRIWTTVRFGAPIYFANTLNTLINGNLSSFGINEQVLEGPGSGLSQEEYETLAHDSVYNDYW
ncbi:hypothetical protein BDQ12DRAFT_694562 [Crucibulum laeve]|uniref:FAD/NAD(P)-binding domain-containing protein n=1 Tax=Crucibulum laeve TaxID=68775 RepID=A0A5C3LDC7_9AGAR|nr:hypothetical protein BDQ12DRAFT_694562 [Crucibulum laeve]